MDFHISSVIDIWALQPQPHLQPRATLRSNGSAISLRAPSGETPAANAPDHPADAQGTQHEPSKAPATATIAPNQKKLPKHWGEVVISSRKGKKSRAADQDNGNDFFGVLKVT